MKPKTYLFPGTVNNWSADLPITGKVVWRACRQAAERAVLLYCCIVHSAVGCDGGILSMQPWSSCGSGQFAVKLSSGQIRAGPRAI
jgi:hypothetical protein